MQYLWNRIHEIQGQVVSLMKKEKTTKQSISSLINGR